MLFDIINTCQIIARKIWKRIIKEGNKNGEFTFDKFIQDNLSNVTSINK